MTARLWSGLAALILLVVVAAGLVFAGTLQQDQTTDRVVGRLQPLAASNLQIRADFATAQSMLRAYLITREPRYLRLYRSERSLLPVALRQANGLSAGRWRALVGIQQRTVARWLGYAGRMTALPPGSPGIVRLTDVAYDSADSFYTANATLSTQARRQSSETVTAGQSAADRDAVIAGVLAALAVLLGLVGVVATMRGITRPLHALGRVMRRQTSGDHEIRASLAGPREIQDVAHSLNQLVDETARLREREAASRQVRQMARDVGLRIRDHLRVEDLVHEARLAIEQDLDADMAYLHVMQDGRLSPPLGHEQDWMMPADFLQMIESQNIHSLLHSTFRRRASLVTQDLTGPEGKLIPSQILEALLAAGIVSQVLVPFGSGSEVLGLIVALRMGHVRPWTEAEVDAIESIASDLGRGLHHARLYETENRLVEELRRIDKAKSDFLATVSHELRTPLTSIAGYVEILRDQTAGPLTQPQGQMLETVDRNAARLRHLIEDVLTLSKIESGAFKTTLQPVDLAEVVGAAAMALQPAAAAKGIAVAIDDPRAGLVVAGDPGQLDRMVMNLLSNAVKFTPDGGKVRVRVASEGTTAVLTVADTGIGIPESDQKGLFNRFFRATNAVHRSIPGTGLGLAIVRTIVANHGGELDVSSREGDGTSVTVTIPLLSVGGQRRQAPEVPIAGGGHPA